MRKNVLKLEFSPDTEAELREMSLIASNLRDDSGALADIVRSFWDKVPEGFECVPGDFDGLLASGANKLTLFLKLKKELIALVSTARTLNGNRSLGIRGEFHDASIVSSAR
jgi:hypothetical protein